MSVLIKHMAMPKGCIYANDKDQTDYCPMLNHDDVPFCQYIENEPEIAIGIDERPVYCPLSDVPDTNVGDTISRQAAIDAIDVLCQEHRYRIPGKAETYSQYNEAWQDALDRAEGAIGNVPAAQPMMTKRSDLINRDDAILAVYKRIKQLGMENNADVLSIRQSIRDLPSAQPDREDLVEKIKNGITASDGNNEYFIGLRNGMRWCLSLIDDKEPIYESSAQPERLTDDDFETIRIHLNAYKEKLCNQRRWKEAEEYQRIIDRFMAFASAQPDLDSAYTEGYTAAESKYRKMWDEMQANIKEKAFGKRKGLVHTADIDAMPTIEPDTCEGCEWEFAFGYGECHRCSRHYEDCYERRTDETTI